MGTAPSGRSSVSVAVPGAGAADELALEPLTAGFESLVHATIPSAPTSTRCPTPRMAVSAYCPARERTLHRRRLRGDQSPHSRRVAIGGRSRLVRVRRHARVELLDNRGPHRRLRVLLRIHARVAPAARLSEL